MESLQKGLSYASDGKPSIDSVLETYSSAAFKKMNYFRKHGLLCDVVIKVEGQEFLAHRVVLAASSDYFDAMFSSGMTECAQLVIELKSINPTIMEVLLDYVYTGQVQVSMDNVQELLPAANLVQMEGVKIACSNFLLSEVDASNVLGIRRFAELHNCVELEIYARNFAAHNFEFVIELEEFVCLTHDELLTLIVREDIHIDSEESVYKAVIRWVYYHPTERAFYLTFLLRNVRLSVLSVRFLTDIVDKDPLIRQSMECRDLVDDAKRFYLRPDLRHEMRERRFYQRDASDEYLVVMGGFGSDQNPSDSVEMFNPRTLEWTELLDLPISYRYVAACSLGTCVYVIGGFDGRNRLDKVCSLDIARMDEGWRWLSPMHYKRGLSSACTNRGLIYVCGGFDGESRLCSLEVYHPKIDEWLTLEKMATAREGCGLVVVDDILYCLGGYDGFHLLNSMEAFHLSTGKWIMCKPMYMRRSGAGCAPLGDTIYVCGGYGGAEGRGPLHLDTVEAYNTRLAQWTLVSNMNVPRCYVGACPLAGKIYVVAGYNGNHLLDTVESYDPVENAWLLYEETRMNHKRCDTGMCVVRFLPSTLSVSSKIGSVTSSSSNVCNPIYSSVLNSNIGNTMTSSFYSLPLSSSSSSSLINSRLTSNDSSRRVPMTLTGQNTELGSYSNSSVVTRSMGFSISDFHQSLTISAITTSQQSTTSACSQLVSPFSIQSTSTSMLGAWLPRSSAWIRKTTDAPLFNRLTTKTFHYPMSKTIGKSQPLKQPNPFNWFQRRAKQMPVDDDASLFLPTRSYVSQNINSIQPASPDLISTIDSTKVDAFLQCTEFGVPTHKSSNILPDFMYQVCDRLESIRDPNAPTVLMSDDTVCVAREDEYEELDEEQDGRGGGGGETNDEEEDGDQLCSCSNDGEESHLFFSSQLLPQTTSTCMSSKQYLTSCSSSSTMPSLPHTLPAEFSNASTSLLHWFRNPSCELGRSIDSLNCTMMIRDSFKSHVLVAHEPTPSSLDGSVPCCSTTDTDLSENCLLDKMLKDCSNMVVSSTVGEFICPNWNANAAVKTGGDLVVDLHNSINAPDCLDYVTKCHIVQSTEMANLDQNAFFESSANNKREHHSLLDNSFFPTGFSNQWNMNSIFEIPNSTDNAEQNESNKDTTNNDDDNDANLSSEFITCVSNADDVVNNMSNESNSSFVPLAYEGSHLPTCIGHQDTRSDGEGEEGNESDTNVGSLVGQANEVDEEMIRSD